MTTGRDNPIRDFIATNWVRYTRETITQQLIEAGYDKRHIDEAWEEVVAADSDRLRGGVYLMPQPQPAVG